MPHGDFALFAVRFVVGLFFFISGYHKLFNAERHASLVATFEADRIPLIRFNEWWVPFVEFLGGLYIISGFLTVCFAGLLFVVCAVATCADGIKRIRSEYKVLDWADFVDDILYLPEVLYAVMLGIIILMGPGKWSIDALILS